MFWREAVSSVRCSWFSMHCGCGCGFAGLFSSRWKAGGCRAWGCWGGCGTPWNEAITFAEFTRRPKWLRMCHWQRFTEFIKFLPAQQLTKLTGFLRGSGDFISLFITLLGTVVDVAAMTYSIYSLHVMLWIIVNNDQMPTFLRCYWKHSAIDCDTPPPLYHCIQVKQKITCTIYYTTL